MDFRQNIRKFKVILDGIQVVGKHITKEQIETATQVLSNFSKTNLNANLGEFLNEMNPFFEALILFAEEFFRNEKYMSIVRISLDVSLGVVEKFQIHKPITYRFILVLIDAIGNYPEMNSIKEFFRLFVVLIKKVRNIKHIPGKDRLITLLSKLIGDVKDTETQAIIFEIIVKLYDSKIGKQLHMIYPNLPLGKTEIEAINEKNIYKYLRSAIQCVNEYSTDICSVDCVSIVFDKYVMPQQLSEIDGHWLDFSICHKKLSFFCDKNFLYSITDVHFENSLSWEVMAFFIEDVLKANFDYDHSSGILKLNLKIKSSHINILVNSKYDLIHSMEIVLTNKSKRFKEFVTIVLPTMFPREFSPQHLSLETTMFPREFFPQLWNLEFQTDGTNQKEVLDSSSSSPIITRFKEFSKIKNKSPKHKENQSIITISDEVDAEILSINGKRDRISRQSCFTESKSEMSKGTDHYLSITPISFSESLLRPNSAASLSNRSFSKIFRIKPKLSRLKSLEEDIEVEKEDVKIPAACSTKVKDWLENLEGIAKNFLCQSPQNIVSVNISLDEMKSFENRINNVENEIHSNNADNFEEIDMLERARNVNYEVDSGSTVYLPKKKARPIETDPEDNLIDESFPNLDSTTWTILNKESESSSPKSKESDGKVAVVHLKRIDIEPKTNAKRKRLSTIEEERLINENKIQKIADKQLSLNEAISSHYEETRKTSPQKKDKPKRRKSRISSTEAEVKLDKPKFLVPSKIQTRGKKFNYHLSTDDDDDSLKSFILATTTPKVAKTKTPLNKSNNVLEKRDSGGATNTLKELKKKKIAAATMQCDTTFLDHPERPEEMDCHPNDLQEIKTLNHTNEESLSNRAVEITNRNDFRTVMNRKSELLASILKECNNNSDKEKDTNEKIFEGVNNEMKNLFEMNDSDSDFKKTPSKIGTEEILDILADGPIIPKTPPAQQKTKRTLYTPGDVSHLHLSPGEEFKAPPEPQNTSFFAKPKKKLFSKSANKENREKNKKTTKRNVTFTNVFDAFKQKERQNRRMSHELKKQAKKKKKQKKNSSSSPSSMEPFNEALNKQKEAPALPNGINHGNPEKIMIISDVVLKDSYFDGLVGLMGDFFLQFVERVKRQKPELLQKDQFGKIFNLLKKQ